MTAPVTITPQRAYQKSVLTPTNGKIRLDARGACTHGFQLTLTSGGEQKKLAFTPLHIDCDERS